MKVAILGYSIEGKISAEYWSKSGNEVTICDKNSGIDVPEGYKSHLGENYLDDLSQFDVIVRTAGLKPSLIASASKGDQKVMNKVTSSLNEFIDKCPTKNLIGVTGTKGKGTTATLVAKILQATGETAHIGGNIGRAPLELLPEVKTDDWVVLELSSFQLIDFKHRIPNTACLSVTKEHLNWHKDIAEYYEAKAQLFKHQRPGDKCVYNANSRVAVQIVDSSQAQKIPYDVPPQGSYPATKVGAYVSGENIFYNGQKVANISDVTLPGHYNLQNVCAAIAIVWPYINGNTDAVVDVLRSFGGLEHHFEVLGDINGVTYVNDSYATAIDATISAVTVYDRPTVLILGGSEKGVEFDPLIDAVVNSSVKHVVLVGNMAKTLQDELAKKGFTNVTLAGHTMREIVDAARAQAVPGDVLLLSPGYASKPEFIDNIDRGTQFKQVVAELRKN